MKNINNCQKCDLYKNQLPLIDNSMEGDVMWVGLSAKKVNSIEADIPLGVDTNTGKVIKTIEEANQGVSFYKTNLVKCLPLNDELKIRYPKKNEQECCYANLEKEILKTEPKLIFLLGLKTANFILSKYNTKIKKLDGDFNYTIYKLDNLNFIPIHHPSYMHIYKRKQLEQYTNSISSIIKQTLEND